MAMAAAVECVGVSKAFREAPEEREPSADRRRGALSWLVAPVIPKRVKVEAVHDVSFDVGRGEIFGILGRNGSGKSTLVRLIATLLTPDSGTIKVFGKDVVADQIKVRKMINRVSVEAAFFKRLSASENLEYAAGLYDLEPREARARARDILSRLDFPARKMNSSLENLSRGMQQKVAVARALLTSPMALLLDEPTTGLDPVSKREVQDFVLEVRATHDTTVILTTHDMQEAERLCDRIAVIDGGRFVALDTPHGLRARGIARGAGEGAGEGLGVTGEELPSLEQVFFALTGTQTDDWLREGGE
jgi:ABC-2 type transport system ATP-binding protein